MFKSLELIKFNFCLLRVCLRVSASPRLHLVLPRRPHAPWGQPTQEEVFQSINQHVGSTVDVTKMVPYLVAGLGLVVLIVWITHQQRYRAVPRTLNHAGKLIKEVSKKIGCDRVRRRR